MGFGLSLLSVITNIFVLAGINDRVKEVDAELSKLNESLRTQAADIDRADLKFDLFTILNHVSKLGNGEIKKAAGTDSIIMLQDFLTIYYSAVNEIPAIELLRTESEQAAALIPMIEKIREAEQLMKAGNSSEAEKLMEEAQRMMADFEPKSELGRKLREIVKFTEADGMEEKNTDEIASELAPRIKSSIDQYLVNYQKKEGRIKALQEKKADLAWKGNLATYAAVSLQLFGLMFVLTKDLMSDTVKRREKADEEARQNSTEAEESVQNIINENSSEESVLVLSEESEEKSTGLNEEIKPAANKHDKAVEKDKKS